MEQEKTIGSMCYRPLVIGGAATPASIFRIIEAVGGTMLIDEADFQDSQIGTDVTKILTLRVSEEPAHGQKCLEQMGSGYEPQDCMRYSGRQDYQRTETL